MSQDFIERLRKNEKEGAVAYVKELLKQAREDRRNDDVDKLEKLVRLLNTKKYGLVWEEHTELVEEEMKTKIPVFVEDETKKIVDNLDSESYNFLLEGDNLHSLHLLKKTHTGAIDVIYIDPPYNTGARNWKYNNNYIDYKDSYKHSKWISMMKSRLDCARLLLKEDGVLVCAIDENEVATLKLLLEEVFGDEFTVDVVTIVQNPRGIQGNNFSYINEFALFVYKKNYKVIFEKEVDEVDIAWSSLRNWGGESLRSDAKNCFYGIKIKNGKIVGFEEVLDDSEHPQKNRFLEDGTVVVYPIDNSGIERKWRYARQTVESIWHILRATFKKGIWDIEIGKPYAPYKTVWTDKKYDANEYGTQLINSIPHNLKYFKTDFVVKEDFPDVSLEYELLNYVTPLVELEFGVDISNPKVQVILSEYQLDKMDETDFVDNSTLFIHPDIFFDANQKRILRDKNITIQEIPNYYFGKDIWS